MTGVEALCWYLTIRTIVKWIGIVLGLILAGVIVMRGAIEVLILFLDTVNF